MKLYDLFYSMFLSFENSAASGEKRSCMFNNYIHAYLTLAFMHKRFIFYACIATLILKSC